MSSKSMSSVTKDVTLPLKVAINKQNTKVLYAEVDSELADVLISFLTLPMGRILRLFKRHYADEAPIIGSLNNLHSSLTNLDDIHFSTKEGKQLLLNPRSLFSDKCRKLKLNLDESHPVKYFACENFGYERNKCRNNRLNIYGWNKCNCGKVMNKELILQESESDSTVKAISSPPRGVFTMKLMDFSISDHLQIVPNGVAFLVQNLLSFGITDTDGMSLTTVPIGLNEVMHLLKGLFVSQTVLTDLVINARLKDSFISKYETGSSADNSNLGKLETELTKKLVVKAVLQKSRKKLVFVQAKEDFVDFLFGLLTIPLGGIANLLDGNTSIISLDTLYGSIFNLEGNTNVMVGEKEDFIGKLRQFYLSPTNILPHTNNGTMEFSFDELKQVLTSYNYQKSCYVGGRTNGCYLREPGMFLVTDDLTVTPSTMFSAISHLNMLKIPTSDVEEVGIEIGQQEALKILKASLTSTSVLTDTLMPLLSKQPK